MAWDATGKWIPEDESTASRLGGLLGANSSYIQSARASGMRTAERRGLQNSSIAAGAAESAAISAAAPIASEDAARAFQRGQTVLESGLARESQGREFAQRSLEQDNNIASSERTSLLGADTNLRQQQIATQGQLSSSYLEAFGKLAGDPNVPADVRNSYITEFQRIMTQGQALIGVVKTTPLTYDTTGTQTAQQTVMPVPADPALPASTPTVAPATSYPAPTGTLSSGLLAGRSYL